MSLRIKDVDNFMTALNLYIRGTMLKEQAKDCGLSEAQCADIEESLTRTDKVFRDALTLLLT